MGLLSKMSQLFTRSGSAASPAGPPATAGGARSDRATDPSASQTVEMKNASHAGDTIATAEPEEDAIPLAQEGSLAGGDHAEISQPPTAPKKNKQELIEELSRNYQEVLLLVRKMSDHIDREAEREDRVTELATKVDEMNTALVKMPDRINEHAGALNQMIVEAINRQAQNEREALDIVIEQSRKAGETQGRLVTTMAEFRETMGDMSRSGERSNEILAEMSRSANDTREEIAELIVTSKKWTTVAMVASLSVAVVAIVIAAISLVMGS